ncbi:MAG: hypothetical protein QG632_840 [Candidatus Dependentiae bacterium]|nr:hypothetical protein [Candidatus Dependentiae bacterium]
MDLFVYFSPAVVWLISGLVLLLIELTTPGLFFFISFAFGCLFGALGGWLGYSFAVQAMVALVVALIQFSGMRRALRRYTNTVQTPTNTQALLGKRAVVTTLVTPFQPGTVKVGGEVWAASSEFNCSVGTVVRVLRVEGNRVVVTLHHTEG